MRTVVGIFATGLSIFSVGLGMYLADWYPKTGVCFMLVGVVYLLWEVLSWEPIVNAIPGMLRFLLGILILAVIIGLNIGIRDRLYPRTSAPNQPPHETWKKETQEGKSPDQPLPTQAIPSARQPNPSKAERPEGKVKLGLALGDNESPNVLMHHDLDKIGEVARLFKDCAEPFRCYSEDDLNGSVVTAGKWEQRFRVFFEVANVSKAIINNPTVTVAVNESDTPNYKGVSVLRINTQSDSVQSKVEFPGAGNLPLLPYSNSDTVYDYVVDVEVRDPSLSKLSLVFRITAANLKVRTLAVILQKVPTN